jgi:hypothetical protein
MYDAGEELSDVEVDLVYTTTGQEMVVSASITPDDGSYRFDDLIPGSYALDLTKLPEYDSRVEVTITENETTMFNASIQYAPVTVSGKTIDEDTLNDVANATIRFTVDATVENNTAVEGSTTSDANAEYTIDLQPGTYTVSVDHMVTGANANVTYSYEETLVLPVGLGTRSYDILLAREE